MVKIKLSLYYNTLLHWSPESVNETGELCWIASTQYLTGKCKNAHNKSIISSTSAYVVRLTSCKFDHLNGRCWVQLSSLASTSRVRFMPCSDRHQGQEESNMLSWDPFSALILDLWIAAIQALFIMQICFFPQCFVPFFTNNFLLNL